MFPAFIGIRSCGSRQFVISAIHVTFIFFSSRKSWVTCEMSNFFCPKKVFPAPGIFLLQQFDRSTFFFKQQREKTFIFFVNVLPVYIAKRRLEATNFIYKNIMSKLSFEKYALPPCDNQGEFVGPFS